MTTFNEDFHYHMLNALGCTFHQEGGRDWWSWRGDHALSDLAREEQHA